MTRKRSYLIGVVILLFIAACGRSLPQSSTIPTPQSATPSPSTLPSQKLSFNTSASSDISSLHVQTDGISCKANVSIVNPNHDYDVGSLNQITSYLNQYYSDYYTPIFLGASNPSINGLKNPPPTLQLVPGSDKCVASYDITNIGNTPIQINGFGLQILDSPLSNETSYNQLDMCDFIGSQKCFGFSHGGNCTTNTVTIDVTNAQKGDTLEKPNQMSPQCGQSLVLEPSQIETVTLFISDSSSQIIKAGFFIDTSINPKTMLPVGFNSNLAFTQQNQIKCYRLDKNILLVESVEEQHQRRQMTIGGICV